MIRKAKGRFVYEVVLGQLKKSSQTQDLTSRKTTQEQEQRMTVTSADHFQCIFSCASSQGTSNLRKHLLSCKSHLVWKQSHVPGSTVITNDGGLTNAKVSEIVFKETTNELLVLGDLPLYFTQSVSWRYFCDRAGLYKSHSRRTANRDSVQMYVRKKDALNNWFKVNKQRISLTTDIWTAHPT